MALAGIGDASAIIAVAQVGLQFAQTLITVIEDFRDAAKNINGLRDELHLTSICLQQLGDLAKQNKIIAGRGILEVTNFRERCRSTIWDIRMIIKKGDEPLDPLNISKEEIDISYFTAWKYALWTKSKLEEPRKELDRLKNSMTLTFVSHMALLASSEYEKAIYIAQIPGYRRNVDWAEEEYRQIQKLNEDQVTIPQEILEAGPDEWKQFLKWKDASTQMINLSSQAELRKRLELAGISEEQINVIISNDPTLTFPDKSMEEEEIQYSAWSLDPFVGQNQMPVSKSWIQNEIKQYTQTEEKLWRTHSRLNHWYKKQLADLIEEQNLNSGRIWTIMTLHLIHRHSFFRNSDNPPCLQIVLKGERTSPLDIQSRIMRVEIPQTVDIPINASNPSIDVSGENINLKPDTETYSLTYEISEPKTKQSKTLSDEEIIEKQLALYKND